MNFRSEYIRKIDPVDDKENDLLEFKMTRTYHFRPDLSNGLTGYETVTTLNPGKYSSTFFWRTLSDSNIINQ